MSYECTFPYLFNVNTFVVSIIIWILLGKHYERQPKCSTTHALIKKSNEKNYDLDQRKETIPYLSVFIESLPL